MGRIIRLYKQDFDEGQLPDSVKVGDDEEVQQTGVVLLRKPGNEYAELLWWVVTVEVERKHPDIQSTTAVLAAPPPGTPGAYRLPSPGSPCKGGHVLIGACGCQAWVNKSPSTCATPHCSTNHVAEPCGCRRDCDGAWVLCAQHEAEERAGGRSP